MIYFDFPKKKSELDRYLITCLTLNNKENAGKIMWNWFMSWNIADHEGGPAGDPAIVAAPGIGPGSGAPKHRQRPKSGRNVLLDKDYKRLLHEEKLKKERAKTKKIEAQTKLLLASIVEVSSNSLPRAHVAPSIDFLQHLWFLAFMVTFECRFFLQKLFRR